MEADHGSGGASASQPGASASQPGASASQPGAAPEQDQYKSQLPLDNVIYSAYKYLVFLFVNYGWHMILCVIVLAILWTNIKPSVMRWLIRREERQEEANFDPIKAERYQDSMLRSRERMQRELEEKAQQYQEVKEERDTKERDERIKQWEEFKVVTKSNSSKPKPVSRDYTPLSGSGGRGSGGYRPQRRTLGGAGGG